MGSIPTVNWGSPLQDVRFVTAFKPHMIDVRGIALDDRACEVLANGKVGARVAELQLAAQERTLVTVESITKELEAARKKADDLDNPGAMTGAIMGKAKVNGLLVDKVDVKAAFSVTISGDDVDL